MHSTPGFRTVIYLAGYRDARNNTWQKRYVGHPDEMVYRSGHLEGHKDRLLEELKRGPKPAKVVQRIRENNEIFGG